MGLHVCILAPNNALESLVCHSAADEDLRGGDGLCASVG